MYFKRISQASHGDTALLLAIAGTCFPFCFASISPLYSVTESLQMIFYVCVYLLLVGSVYLPFAQKISANTKRMLSLALSTPILAGSFILFATYFSGERINTFLLTEIPLSQWVSSLFAIEFTMLFLSICAGVMYACITGYCIAHILHISLFVRTHMLRASFSVLPMTIVAGVLIGTHASTDQSYAHSAALNDTAQLLQTDSRENVFILQLESVNSHTAFGHATVGKKQYRDSYVPALLSAAKRGIFFPYFWSNSHLTHRSQVSILCALVDNFGKGYSLRPNEIPVDCLPKILANSGYQTLFFRSDDLSFTNIGNFMKKIGMHEVHHEDIMQDGDTEYAWGYDDCTFYKRSFEYLQKEKSDQNRLFAYFEVSSHHVPFPAKEEYAHVAEFEDPQNYVEKYINSLKAQDYCVGEFMKYYDAFAAENTHLFIVADNSFPMHGDTYFADRETRYDGRSDNHLTPLVYIQPKNTELKHPIAGRQIDVPWQSHGDLMQIIFGVLNREQYPRSLPKDLFSSRWESVYEKQDPSCHVLQSPLEEQTISIVRWPQKYTYSRKSGWVTESNLEHNLFENVRQNIGSVGSVEEFMEKYGCTELKIEN